MATSTPRYTNMGCPRCGSFTTQVVPLAFSQALRVGHSGYQTNSQFGQRLAPPAPRDERFVPGLAACVAAGASMFVAPELLDKADISPLTGLSSFSSQVVVLSFVIGWAVGLAIAAPAIIYNLSELPDLLREWEAGVVCKRCGHIWQDLATETKGPSAGDES